MSSNESSDSLGADATDVSELDLEWLSLEDDESIRWASGPHEYSIVPAILVGAPFALVLVGIPIIVAAYLNYKNTVYVVTDRGLYGKRGVLSRDVKQIGFDKVQNISYSQSAIGSSLGYGSVDISTAGGSGTELKLRGIPNPASVQELISGEVDSRRQDGTGTEDTDADVLDEILVELRGIRSAVTDDESQVAATDSAGDDTTSGRPRGDGHEER
jgi:uncharacterized membrane protein YdbT with pleckstrin-like domain